MLGYVNGAITEVEKARVGVLDRGFLLGDGVFETVRVLRGRPLFLARHLERMREGAAFLGIPFPGKEKVVEAVREVINVNQIADGGLRITLSRGQGEGLFSPGPWQPTLVVTPRMPARRGGGYSAVFLSFRRNNRSPLFRFKTLSMLENVLGRREALEKGADEGIFLNVDGFVAEGAATNIFICSGGKLVTPPVESGCLPGIARGVVLELAASLGMEVEEKSIPPEEVFSAEAAFLTNALVGVVPLVSVDGRPIGQAKAANLWKEVINLYHYRLDKEIEKISL